MLQKEIKPPFTVQQLKTLLSKGAFTLYFQPIISIATNNIVGAEALARLNVGDKVYSPYFFINTIKLGGKFLEQFESTLFKKFLSACNVFQEHDICCPISYNISAKHLNRPGCALALVNEYYKYTNKLAIIIEITEQEGIDTSFSARDNIQMLSDNFELYIDDFGTGYSNLSYVLDYPFKGLKIDKSLIDNLATDLKPKLLLRGLIPTLETLNVCTVAEGIETIEQFKTIEELGFAKGQGYLWSVPLTLEQFITAYQLHSLDIIAVSKILSKMTDEQLDDIHKLVELAPILNRSVKF